MGIVIMMNSALGASYVLNFLSLLSLVTTSNS